MIVPPLDKEIGIDSYYTDGQGCGGSIKSKPDDFVVSEIISDAIRKSIKEEGEYAVYSLSKRGVDTAHCIYDVYRRCRVRLKALGLKDSKAYTTQYVCATSKRANVTELHADRYDLVLLGYVKRPLTKKAMIGNHFVVKIRDTQNPPDKSTNYDMVPNHYGYQRFGSRRPFTHLIGRAILHGDYNSAIHLILYEESIHDTPQAIEIRRRLADATTHAERLSILPNSMDIERTVLKSLHQSNHDHRAAIVSLPLYLRRLYVQAYQSYIFNLTLSTAISEGYNIRGPTSGDVCFDVHGKLGKYDEYSNQMLAIPTVGYAYYKKTRFHPILSDIMSREGITPKDFYIKQMQELSLEGGFRQATISCKDYAIHDEQVSFTLSRGSFATMILREIIKPTDPIRAGF